MTVNWAKVQFNHHRCYAFAVLKRPDSDIEWGAFGYCKLVRGRKRRARALSGDQKTATNVDRFSLAS